MFFFTIWGGADVRPRDPDNIVVTVWGGTSILLPTLAEKILRMKKAKQDDGEITDAVVRRTNVITVMGGTSYKFPTLAKEIEQMRHLKDSGGIPENEIYVLWQEAIRREDLDLFESLTIMAAAEYESPGRKEELKDLERIAAHGIITGQEHDEFRALIERNFSSSSEEIQQKLLRMLQPGSIEPLPKAVSIQHSAMLE